MLKNLTFMFKNLHLAKAEVFFVLPVVPDVDELPGVAVLFVAVEQSLLIL